MEWTQFAIVLITFAGIFIWNRTESRADYRNMDAKLESNRNLTIEIYKEAQNFRIEAREMIAAIQEEIKDFHGRLCAIEERKKK